MTQPLRILICDDNVDGARAMALWLELEGHEARTVHNGAAALAAARTWPPDVVLMDISLTGRMDGVQTVQSMRRDLGLADALIVAVTGRDGDGDRQRTKEAGFDLHLVKPVETEVMAKVLSQAKRLP
jgi:CheY-like chemotaxis protein